MSIENNLEIYKTLVLSTAHLTEGECNAYIPRMIKDGDIVAINTGYGWLIHIDSMDDASLNVIWCMKFLVPLAKSLKVDWIKFDNDGMILDGLQVYHW